MSQAAYDHGYDDGFEDGRMTGLAAGGRGVEFAVPGDALDPARVNLVTPTVRTRGVWTPLAMVGFPAGIEYRIPDTVDTMGDTTPWYQADIGLWTAYTARNNVPMENYDGGSEFASYTIGALNPDAASLPSAQLTPCHYHVDSATVSDEFDGMVVYAITGTFSHPGLYYQGAKGVAIPFTAVVAGGDPYVTITSVAGSYDDLPDMASLDVPSGFDPSRQDYPDGFIGSTFATWSTTLTALRREFDKKPELGGAPGYKVLLTLPADAATADAPFSFAGATVEGAMPTAPGTYMLDLVKTGSGYRMNVTNL